MERLKDWTVELEHTQGAQDYIRFLRATLAGPLTGRWPVELLRAEIGGRSDRFEKAVMDPATSAGALAAQAALGRTFLGIVVRQTLLGQLVGATSAPANQALPFGSLEPTPGFVAEFAPIPVAQGTIGTIVLSPVTKVGTIITVTKELVIASDDRALAVLQQLLARAIREGQDEAFLSSDPAIEREHPGGLLADLSPVGGGSPDDLDDDLLNVVRSVSGGDPAAPCWIVSPLGAAYLRTLDGRFQGVTGTPGREGELLGMRQLCSVAAHDNAVLVDAASVAWWNGDLLIEASSSVALQLDDAPSAGATTHTSLFQTNSTALKVRRFVSWGAVPGSVGFTTLPLGSPS